MINPLPSLPVATVRIHVIQELRSMRTEMQLRARSALVDRAWRKLPQKFVIAV